DFWITTEDARWKALISRFPTLWTFVRRWMSGSPARCSSVRSRNRMPSGSSWAMDPARMSWMPGNSLRANRKASITPRGSFHGSNRETCTTMGRSPALLLQNIEQGRGLGIVHEDVVVSLGELPRVGPDPVPIGAPHLLGPRDLSALQRVVHRLGDRVVLVGALEQRPGGLDAQVVQQREL